jgi:hypothetical protein
MMEFPEQTRWNWCIPHSRFQETLERQIKKQLRKTSACFSPLFWLSLEKGPKLNITLGTPKGNKDFQSGTFERHIFIRKTIKQRELASKVMIFRKRCTSEPIKHLFKPPIIKIKH